MEARLENAENQKPERKRVVDLLARAELHDLTRVWDGLPQQPEMQMLRGPEIGLVMVRGRIGGGGAPFNLGEATVSRATVRLDNGLVGHGHVLGANLKRAKLAAVFDALWQDPQHREIVEAQLLQPVERRIAEDKRKKSEEVAATRVDFFTMVRGED
ncbi:MAG: phosphonate C-P lyase system protein PhnG [Alphaproteobacteria bacterium]|jgi:alpha-D-ribose 1-methylphosphonate 5-triphosphate synthase subunit PhnG|nr:phosphonate C-P lyase system protein PhnG [Rhizobiaceae bacterium]MBU3963680.1 phosphonate C-P lyase system protein PhnG [Alphaproteobacteria bacterium]MBU4051295.1 phosphonate C-P lyase system protein PhnG [Alphaproteobacteria bacterium]MBU4090594.1 phosphonate C-P lyase system protein PhnG [Alphaproteobacteria bacterium]MBU4156051.1 phosphonate C-P lyase system protein PhnG [Alphaproteobacteria bacterium]